jgi:hypothetical protein
MLTITDRDGRDWEVDFDASEGEPAKLSGHPDTWHPGDPGHFDFLGATCVWPEEDHKVVEKIEEFTAETGLDESGLKEILMERAADEAGEAAWEAKMDRDHYRDHGPW